MQQTLWHSPQPLPPLTTYIDISNCFKSLVNFVWNCYELGEMYRSLNLKKQLEFYRKPHIVLVVFQWLRTIRNKQLQHQLSNMTWIHLKTNISYMSSFVEREPGCIMYVELSDENHYVMHHMYESEPWMISSYDWSIGTLLLKKKLQYEPNLYTCLCSQVNYSYRRGLYEWNINVFVRLI